MALQSAAVALPARAVLADLVPRTALLQSTLVVGGAAVVGLLAQVVVPLSFTPVPLTGQTLGVLLVGSALGARRAVAALTLYAVAGLAGVPWFAGGGSGWSAAAFGYVLGFVAAAALCGALARRGGDRSMLRALGSMVLGSAAVYAVGVAWLAVVVGVPGHKLLAIGVAPFLVGDAIKAALAAGLLPGAWRLLARFENLR
jgi:biotin transport system substrate-specific component